MKPIVLLTALACACACPAAVQAQAAPRLSLAVGTISTTQSCTYFREQAGRAAVVATPWMVAAAASWRTWWVKDCVDNFATMRSTLASALAAAPGAQVAGGGRYRVSLNITQVSDPSGPAPTAPGGGDFGIAQSFMVVSFDLAVRDAAGRSVYGTLMTKRIETGSDVRADGFRATSASGGAAAYGVMQNAIALAAARAVAFHFRRIEVTSGGGGEVQLNYGAPYLTLGDLVMVTPADRSAPVRYRVTAALDGSATAEAEQGGDSARVGPGSTGTFVEAEDPMQNGRRFKRVDLP